MEKIFHPVSGEMGFFCTETEKEMIDSVISTFLSSDGSSSNTPTASMGRGVAVE